MPTISMFYGILIRMFFKDIERHRLPHIHAEYQGQTGVYSISDGLLLAGELPPNKHKLVVAWIEFIRMTCLPTGNLQSMARSHSRLEDSINENCRTHPQVRLDFPGCRQ
jgi:hypothetical protein